MKKNIDVDKIKRSIARKQNTINRLSRNMKRTPTRIFVGWDAKSGTYPEQNGKSVAYVAAIHELGLGNHTAKHMSAINNYLHSKEWSQIFAKEIKKRMKKGNTDDLYEIIEKIGERMKEDLSNYVYQIDLVDTQRLANSVIIRYKRNK